MSIKLDEKDHAILTLIQENSKLNTKYLPEVTEKKPWWKIW